MPRVQRTAQAADDYLDIWKYIAQDNVEAANRLVRLFDEKANLLAQFPLIGRRRAELFPGMRSFPIGDYLMFYRPTQDGIELIRVLHGKQNLRSIFKRNRGIP